MSSQYTPTTTVWHEDAPIPDDAAPPTAAEVSPGIEAALDNAAYLKEHSPRLKSQEFLATAVAGFTVPARVTKMLAIIVGGGGGGGGGKGGGTATTAAAAGGGGGGGAHKSIAHLTVTPGQILDITIGAGGTGGIGGAAGGTNGNAGQAGGDSIIAVNGGAELARAKGAGGGSGGKVNGNGTTTFAFTPGAFGAHSDRSPPESFTSTLSSPVLPCGYGAGGAAVSFGASPNESYRGHPSLEGYAGGFAAGLGGNSGSYFAGAGGGGGGAGPFGAGPTAFPTQGAANGAGTATAPAASTNAAANSGAGGMGGCGGAAGSTAGSAGGTGGNGGSGRVILTWTVDEA